MDKGFSARVLAWSRLMRWHQPVGFALLWWPLVWTWLLASRSSGASWETLLTFTLGAWVMRSAGCVINDWADRGMDGGVERTRQRPLVVGDIGGWDVLGVLGVLLGVAAILASTLKVATWPWVIVALGLAMFYPFTKRLMHAPQLVLGLAFACAVPLMWVELGQSVSLTSSSLGLVLGGAVVLWTISYDTLYALADFVDDWRLGVKSLATGLGARRAWGLVVVCGVLGYTLLAWVGMQVHLSPLAWLMGGGGLVWHMQLWWRCRKADPQVCFRAFRLHAWWGGWMAWVWWVGLCC